MNTNTSPHTTRRASDYVYQAATVAAALLLILSAAAL
jgi:hypothetical protein